MAADSPTPKHPKMAPGQRYGRLVAVEFVGRDERGDARWSFRCDCGKMCEAFANKVRRGHRKSCGCLHDAGHGLRTHGLRNSPEYAAWKGMRVRCLKENSKNFASYGGRGIKVCDRWQKFENFYADMGPRPSQDHSIDRIDNDLGYSPENCRWSTRVEQANNRRTNHLVLYQGKEMTLREAARRFGVASYNVVKDRMQHGWAIEKALETPKHDPRRS